MHLKDTIIIGITMLVIDYLYLSNIGGPPFLRMVENIQNEKSMVKYKSAALVYILMVIAMQKYVITSQSHLNAFLLGIIIYGVFDFTNMAIFNKYELKIAILDTLWGGILFTITNLLYHKINSMLKN